MRAWPVSNGMVRWLLTALVVERVVCAYLVKLRWWSDVKWREAWRMSKQTDVLCSGIMYVCTVRTLCA